MGWIGRWVCTLVLYCCCLDLGNISEGSGTFKQMCPLGYAHAQHWHVSCAAAMNALIWTSLLRSLEREGKKVQEVRCLLKASSKLPPHSHLQTSGLPNKRASHTQRPARVRLPRAESSHAWYPVELCRSAEVKLAAWTTTFFGQDHPQSWGGDAP